MQMLTGTFWSRWPRPPSRSGWAASTVPRLASTPASPSIDPIASASGLTWQTNTTRCAVDSASAARPSSSGGSGIVVPLYVQPSDQLVDASHVLHPLVLLEPKLRRELHPHLPPENGPQVLRRRAEPGPGRHAVGVLAEHGVEDDGSPEVRPDLHSGDGHEAPPGVLQLGDLLGQDLPELLGDPLGAETLSHPDRGGSG